MKIHVYIISVLLGKIIGIRQIFRLVDLHKLIFSLLEKIISLKNTHIQNNELLS